MKVKEILQEDIGNVLHQLMDVLISTQSGSFGLTPTILAYATVYAMYRAGVAGVKKVVSLVVSGKNNYVLNNMKAHVEDITRTLPPHEVELVHHILKRFENALSKMDANEAEECILDIRDISNRNKPKV